MSLRRHCAARTQSQRRLQLPPQPPSMLPPHCHQHTALSSQPVAAARQCPASKIERRQYHHPSCTHNARASHLRRPHTVQTRPLCRQHPAATLAKNLRTPAVPMRASWPHQSGIPAPHLRCHSRLLAPPLAPCAAYASSSAATCAVTQPAARLSSPGMPHHSTPSASTLPVLHPATAHVPPQKPPLRLP
jgi:hypothetical protein